jgi:radical SAM protein with 4Fe4S-binding SPASM domain
MIVETLQEQVTKAIMGGTFSEIAPLAILPVSNYALPIYVQVEATTKCNLKCRTCRRTNEVNRDISLGLFKSIVDQFNKSTFIPRRLDLTGLGEPLFHSNIVEMVSYAKKFGFRVSLTSNLTVFNQNNPSRLVQSGLDYLYISFDGASKDTFEKIRVGSNFDKVVENIKHLVRTKRDLNSRSPKLLFESTISQYNAKEIHEIVKLAESLEVDGVYFFRQVTPDKEDYGSDYFASQNWEDLAKSRIEIQAASPEKPPRPCVGVIGCYITFDGKVLQCNRLIQLLPREEYSHFQFGDLNRNPLSEIWFSDSYRRFRTRVALGMYSSLCKSCPTASG